MSTQTILDQLLLVTLNISFWSGRKALLASEIAANGIDVGALPQGTLATLESRMIIPPDTVKIFSALKREAITAVLKNGISFRWGGYAVPRDHVAQLFQELLRLKDEFESAKANFMTNFEQDISIWVQSHPAKHRELVRQLVDATRYLHHAVSFTYCACEVKIAADMADKEESGFAEEINSLHGLLCQEIRETAYWATKYYFTDREEITRKTLRPVKAIREKLAGLHFLHPTIIETVQLIDDTLNRLPKYGAITGDDLATVADLVKKQLATMGRMSLRQHGSDEMLNVAPSRLTENTGKVAPIAWDF